MAAVFYDRKKRRGRYSKGALALIAIFLVAVFSITLGSVFTSPNLPDLDIKNPEVSYRGVPNVIPSSPTVSAASSIPYGPLPINNAVALEQNSQVNRPKVLGFYVNWDDNSFTSLKKNIGNIDELIPEWLHLSDADGSVSVDDQAVQDKTLGYIRQVRPDLPVSVLINNFNSETQNWDDVRVSQMLSNPSSRSSLIDNILNFIEQNKLTGVSIDFENIPPERQADLILFMKETYEKLHPLGIEISQNIPLEDPLFKAEELGKYSDFLILMAYDENSIHNSLAGPVASQNWIVRALSERFSFLPSNKFVVAVGGYGYDWPDGETDGQEVTFQDAMRIAKEAGSPVTLDPTFLNPNFDYFDENGKLHHVWFLDAVTAFNEMVAGKRLGGPYGYALWRLGSEDPSVWTVFNGRERVDVMVSESLNNTKYNFEDPSIKNALAGTNKIDSVIAQSLGTMQYGYDLRYKGRGEILKVTGVPHEGKRDLRLDNDSGFIAYEKITDYPSPYDITRWGKTDEKKIALTFDDGPDSKYTPQILDILKKYDVPGTFFLIGANANLNPDLVRRIYQEGNEIGNHTYSHPNITRITTQQFNFELDSNQRIIEGILGRKTLLFRPPYAEDIEPETPDQAEPLAEAEKLGYYTVGMHIDPKDWSSPGVDRIVKSIIDETQAGKGNVVLLHDGGGDRAQTIAALPYIIEQLQSRGYQIVGISDLLGVDRDTLIPLVPENGKTLSQINGVTINIMTCSNSFIKFMFILGIILGMSRFLFIGSLAILEWAHSRRNSHKKYRDPFNPSVSVIIPAFNEVKVIVKTVESILKSDYPSFDVIIVDDGSEDETYRISEVAFGKNNRVRIYSKEREGKAEALNLGVLRSQAEIVVTLDADTVFLPDTISKLVRKFRDKRIGAVAGNSKVGNRVNLLTRWQALEYITSQNLDRRAFEAMNAITVVPGAVGAWRRDAVIKVGGFSGDTLAEDTDLTFTITRSGYKVAFEDEAIAFTEAPDNTRNFLKQRFRWMFGTLQAVWKHKDTLGKKRFGAIGLFTIPNVLVFQILFPLISPFMDLAMLLSIAWASWQAHYHPVDFSAFYAFHEVLRFYLLFLAVDLITSAIPFILEHKEDWTLIAWMPFQRFYYRQLMYYVAIKSIWTAVKGRIVGWGKFERKATVEVVSQAF